MNLIGSDCGVSKTILNDMDPVLISWELNTENPLLNFCVGVWAWGQDATNFSHVSKDAQENSTSFDTDVVTGGDRGKWF